MIERRFDCTACGKCCHGWIPLTIADALSHAHRFPLAVVWTTIRPGGRSFAQVGQLGMTVALRKNKPLALRISPTAYIPPALPCPVLADNRLCGIHADKPARCRAMPFSPYHDESDQEELLLPKAGWECDTSQTAPVVYRDGIILERENFDLELRAIIQEAPTLRAYANWLLDYDQTVAERLLKTSSRPSGGHIVLAFHTLLARLPRVDMIDFASRQLPVLKDFAERTATASALAEYHATYLKSAAYLERILEAR